MSGTIVRMVATILVCLLAPAVLRAADQVNVSAGVAGANMLSEMAVDARTGNVLVVWMNRDFAAGTSGIWGRLARRTANGYSLKKAIKLSGEEPYNANPDVTYVPEAGEFLVVWDTASPTGVLAASPILGRIVNARGKAKGAPFSVVDNLRRNQVPRLALAEGSGVSPANHVDLIRFICTSYPTPEDPDAGGVKFGTLDQTYRFLSNTERTALPILLEPLGSGTPTIADCTRQVDVTDLTVLPLLNDRFRVQANWHGYERQANQQWEPANGMFWFFNEDNTEAVIKVLNGTNLNGQSHFWVFAGGLTNVEYTITITDSSEGHTLYKTPLGEPFSPVTDTEAFATCPFPVGTGKSGSTRRSGGGDVAIAAIGLQVSDLFAYQYTNPAEWQIGPAAKKRIGQVAYAVVGQVKTQNLLVKGKGKLVLSGIANTLFAYSHTLTTLRGEWHSPSNTRLILWGKLVTSTDQQVWLHIS